MYYGIMGGVKWMNKYVLCLRVDIIISIMVMGGDSDIIEYDKRTPELAVHLMQHSTWNRHRQYRVNREIAHSLFL